MVIRKYKEFIKESKLYKDYSSFGEYIDSLYKDENIRAIVSKYTDDIDPTVSIINIIDNIDLNIVNKIKDEVESYFNNNVNESVAIGGKNIFKTFLKLLTALGLKENLPSWEETPNDFIIYYKFDDINNDKLKSIVDNRFKSIAMLDAYDGNECNLYFGIKDNLTFEYGFRFDNIKKVLGSFKINNSSLKWLLLLNSPSVTSLKKILVNIDFNKLSLFIKIKKELITFNPGYFEKRNNPVILDDVISFSFIGLGKWNNGLLLNDSLLELKNKFKEFVSNYKWSQKVLIKLDNKSYVVNFNIKIR